MSLQHLRTFVEVHRRRSISEAARTLGLTQPAVSQHVAALEVQLGQPLFERHARGVLPTWIADDLAARLGDTLTVAETALAEARARTQRLSGTVHLAAPADLLAEWVAPRLGSLIAAGLDLRLHTGGRNALYSMLLEDKVHLAITASQVTDPRLAFEPVGTERLLAVAAPAMAETVVSSSDRWEALRGLPWLAYDLDRPLMRDWFAANGLEEPGGVPVATAPDLRVLRSMIGAGLGWSVLPDYLTRAERDRGDLVELPPPKAVPENRFHLVWAKAALRHPRVAFARDRLIEALAAKGAVA
jgi:DNA-binding transcriptional LysR family regulator